MAKKPAKKSAKAKPAVAKKSPMRSPLVWLLIIIVAGVLFPATMLLIVSGMVPTLVAFIVDNHPRRHATRTVAYLNMAGTFIVAMDMWQSGDDSLQRAAEMLGDPINWGIMFGLAGLGWAIYYTLPPLVLSVKTISNDVQMKKLKQRQLELTKEWGLEVADTAPLIPEDLIADAEEAMKAPGEQRKRTEEDKDKDQVAES
ncbi:hypothetical protein [Aestuariispira insulae]|uniref:Uncharacterized protein n=1 Tax=Aestuariispira insulae TaxID=1461337 RepID=A0A3D9HVX1_9PROT|nr:hypothetical protein [Aestuariispira insulae]RED53638.1 hypothetical protein DFP90_101430 [Aestuariispira insulae]